MDFGKKEKLFLLYCTDVHTQTLGQQLLIRTLLPVTRLHHIYSTALVIIGVIDNLKYVIIFKHIDFFHGKFHKSPKMYLDIQAIESLRRRIVQMFTTDGSNHLINFPLCNECKEERQKPLKRPKTKD